MPPIAIDDATLLDAWDRAGPLARPWRELTLLAAAGESVEVLARLPVGERDRRLLELRSAWLGDRVDGETICPECDERLELTLSASAIGCPAIESALESSVEHGEYRVRFRLPTSADLVESGSGPNAASVLLALCVLEAARGHQQLDADALPAETRAAVVSRMSALDPQADVRLALDCPACGHRWDAELDVAGYVLAEIDTHAARLLREVHGLARAYGWSEAEILALSPRRRRQYLELAWS